VARKKEWFNDKEFWERYAPVMFDDKRWAEVGEVADGVTRLAQLRLYPEGEGVVPAEGAAPPIMPLSAPRIADLCCGFGRLTLEFARRGFAATGVDLTESYLRAAREDAAYENLDIEFIRQDVRDFTRPGFFDIAVNLYVSFGYFADPADDRRFVKNAYDSLKPGGSLIIDTLGKELAVRDFVEAEWFERAGYFILTEYEVVESWSSLQNRWILIDKGEREGDKVPRQIERTFTQRLYAASELRALLFEAGFSEVELYGGWDESPYDNMAERLIAVGRKEEY
jgi:SAM-dependent methyltransferase